MEEGKELVGDPNTKRYSSFLMLWRNGLDAV